MNQNFNKSFLFIMRSSFIFAICNCFFSALIIASPVFSKKLELSKVSINFNGEPLEECLKQIESKTSIHFVFNPDELKDIKSNLLKPFIYVIPSS